MLTTQDVSMRFGDKVLFQGVTVTFNDGERYGLTGPNGCGKSTFMKIIAGELEADGGRASARGRLGVLRQDQSIYDEERIIDVVLMGNTELWSALREKQKLVDRSDDLTDDEGMRLGELEALISEEGGYTAESEAASLLEGLG